MSVSVYTTLKNNFQTFLDILYPPRCVSCNRLDEWLCPNCWQQIPFITFPVCHRCGTPGPVAAPSHCQQCAHNRLRHIDAIRAVSYFEDGPIRRAIHYLKYNNRKAVSTILGKILADGFQRFNLTADVIVPVTLHPARLHQRGYNQSELLARELGHLLDIPVNSSTLQRIRNTKSQMELSADERHQNIMNAFVCRDEKLSGQKILLIDDVCTTGSTLDACADALKQRGAASVWGLTLAKARRLVI
jgi:ComF family protein